MKNNLATVQPEILSDNSVVYNAVQNGEAIMHPAPEAEAIAICDHINSGARHTPGPWVAAGESIITKDDKHCIAVIESDGGYEAPQEQREGNAHLIAAAPDLLAALENAVVLVHHLAHRQRITEIDVAQANAALPIIRAAIAQTKVENPCASAPIRGKKL